MYDSHHLYEGNRSLSIKDVTGAKWKGLFRLGYGLLRYQLRLERKIELRAAVRNLLIHPVELTNDFRLAVKHGDEVHEYLVDRDQAQQSSSNLENSRKSKDGV